MKKGMIVYSFAWREIGDSICNENAALSAERIIALERSKSNEVVVFAQRATARTLRELQIECQVVKAGAGYEGSEEVTTQAAEVFRRQGITEVIPVAHPLQLPKCVALIQKAGFKTQGIVELWKLIGKIGFDPLSAQWWTRGPIRLVVYTVLQITHLYKAPPELSEP